MFAQLLNIEKEEFNATDTNVSVYWINLCLWENEVKFSFLIVNQNELKRIRVDVALIEAFGAEMLLKSD